ncbi:hypothetical protein [Curtobacterium sp. MCBD17_032]|uniref:hypothetical protein n=1 Tax=Curtobacterium sp. MCBD17_032 TaxID=2175659 RepID=UPI000DAA563B|nr:hypothetical protein [Curtobacterium sp. MCBD17_032]PZE86926.1 hypothetical protein DEI91_01085 [Curtobacterium sp. MCBD17_032]
MNVHPVLLGSAAVIGTCLLAPSFLAAPANAAPLAPTVRTVAAAASSVVTGVTQEQHASGAKRWVRLAVSVSARTAVQLRDASGEVVQAESATPRNDAVFRLEPTGADTARYTIVTNGVERTVDVDFHGLGLSAPVDQTDERGLERLRRAIVAGDTDHGIRYHAVPGAEVAASANGRTETAVAGADGIATVLVHFVRGENEVSVRQTLGAASSDVDVDHYLFDGDGDGGGTGGGHPGPGDGDGDGGGTGGGHDGHPDPGEGSGDGHDGHPGPGEGPGDEDGSTVPSDDAFTVDVDRTRPLQPVDGKVTVGGTATRGEVTVSDVRGGPLGTTTVHDGRWSIEVPVTAPGGLRLRFDLRPERGGPISDSVEAIVLVDSAPSTPFTFERAAQYQRHDGLVHFEGTAPEGRVVAFRLREKIGETRASEGRWSVDVPLAAGRHGVRFQFVPDGAGAPEEQTALIEVVD